MTETPIGTEALVAAFLARTLPKVAWTHVAHLRVGLWHVRRFGEKGALTRLRDAIRAYNEAVGTANTDASGYHETLTVLYVRVIADFVEREPAAAAIADEALEAGLIARTRAADGVLLPRPTLLGRGAQEVGTARSQAATGKVKGGSDDLLIL